MKRGHCSNMDEREQDLLEQSALLKSREEFYVWEQRCNEYLKILKSLEEQSRSKQSRLSIGTEQSSSVTRITQLEDLKDTLRQRFMHASAGCSAREDDAGLSWREIDTAFGNRVLTGAVVNYKHIEPRQFLEDARYIILDRVRNVMQIHDNIKVNTVFNAEFVAIDKYANKSVDTKNCKLFRTSNLQEWYKVHVIEPILASLDEFQDRDSGWTLSRIINLTVNMNKYNPLRAGCSIEMPREIKLKRAVINVQSRDDACFAWSVVAALHPSKVRTARVSSYPNYKSVLNLRSIEFPMTLDQIAKFEHLNDISVNVYSVEKKEKLVILPIRLTDEKKDKHVNLLYIQDDNDNTHGHFAWIKNLSRLMSFQVTKKQHKIHFCDRCLHYFTSSEKLEDHGADCQEMNDYCAIGLPSDKDKLLRFDNYSRKERVPFVIYADLECTLEKTDEDLKTPTYTYQHHRVHSIGYYVSCSYDDTLSMYRFRRDKDCVAWFAEELRKLAHNVMSGNVSMTDLTDLTQDEWEVFNNATHCHVCENPFAPGDAIDARVRDRCHMTDRYKGPVHSNCNVSNYKYSRFIPVIFRNLSGYASHLIIKEIATAYEGRVELLPITKEKYIAFTKNFESTDDEDQKICVKLRFIDSCKFLNTGRGLDKLASLLSKDKLRILRYEFRTVPVLENFDLLTRKGVFPCIDCVEKLEDLCLPPRESFYSSLTGDTVSESEYAHAVNVWQRFSIRTLGEYSDLCLKTDVLLLADVFENFRESCIASYELDPAHYDTLADFTWDAMLKHTRVNFELLTDIDMVLFIRRGIRGGLSQCSNRYARANNKYIQSYDPSKSSSYLMYFNVNDLYGWAMCRPLPYADFRWVDHVSNFDVTTIALDSPTGYILEVDLEYPQHLHDSHIDLPFCPTREKPPRKRQDKLLATLWNKKRYIIHYRNLQQCIRHGLRVTKIHRVLQFAQSPWLRDYIEHNTNFRTSAKNDFEANLYKLMNNAIFDKTMENVRNERYVDVKLVTAWDGRYGAETIIARPNFQSRSILSENLIVIEIRKLEIEFNTPIYVDMCLLDISKTCLYDFHYEYMLPLHGEKCKIMYTDTDTLIYHIECNSVYDTMKRDTHKFDTSDYAVDNAYGIPLVNKNIPGLIKDKNNGAIMTEFVGLRSKMYALRVDDEKDTKVEGVKRNVAKMITFDDYTWCLRDQIEMTRQQSSVRSKLREEYTMTETSFDRTKIALSPYDDKRYIVPDSTETLPWGHYRIP